MVVSTHSASPAHHSQTHLSLRTFPLISLFPQPTTSSSQMNIRKKGEIIKASWVWITKKASTWVCRTCNPAPRCPNRPPADSTAPSSRLSTGATCSTKSWITWLNQFLRILIMPGVVFSRANPKPTATPSKPPWPPPTTTPTPPSKDSTRSSRTILRLRRIWWIQEQQYARRTSKK